MTKHYKLFLHLTTLQKLLNTLAEFSQSKFKNNSSYNRIKTKFLTAEQYQTGPKVLDCPFYLESEKYQTGLKVLDCPFYSESGVMFKSRLPTFLTADVPMLDASWFGSAASTCDLPSSVCSCSTSFGRSFS